jgi:hypothetical protein
MGIKMSVRGAQDEATVHKRDRWRGGSSFVNKEGGAQLLHKIFTKDLSYRNIRNLKKINKTFPF